MKGIITMSTFEILSANLDSIRACFPYKSVVIEDSSYDDRDKAKIIIRCKSFRTHNLSNIGSLLDDLGIGWFNHANIDFVDEDHLNLVISCSTSIPTYDTFGIHKPMLKNTKSFHLERIVKPELESIDWKKTYIVESAISYDFANLYIVGNTFSAFTLQQAVRRINNHSFKVSIPCVKLRTTEDGKPISELVLYVD